MMKRIAFTFLLLLLITVITGAKPNTSYYWVVESTGCRQGSSVIRVYNQDHELIYTEKIEGRTIDIRDKRVIDRLNRKVRKLKALQEKV